MDVMEDVATAARGRSAGRGAADAARAERRSDTTSDRAAPAREASAAAAPAAAPPPPVALSPPPPAASQRTDTGALSQRALLDTQAARNFVQTDSAQRARASDASATVAEDAITITAGGVAVTLDRVLVRERAGTLRMETVRRADRGTRGAGAWIVEGVTVTDMAIAEGADYRLVRVRQRLASGTPIDVLTLLSSQAPAIAGLEMSKAVEQAAAGASPFTTMPGSPRLLIDGRRELRLRAIDAPVWVVMRADLGSESLTSLVERLGRLPR
jgi:hypothetical protein